MDGGGAKVGGMDDGGASGVDVGGADVDDGGTEVHVWMVEVGGSSPSYFFFILHL